MIKMHPHLMKTKGSTQLRKSSAQKDRRMVYDSSEDQTDYLGERISAEELVWLLNPKLEYHEDGEDEGIS
jgi:hypothetical protein